MFSRRYLRIKAMQALYAYFQSNNRDLGKGEKELFLSIHKIYELYHFLLLLLGEIRFIAQKSSEDGKLKLRPTKAELDPSLRFVNNRVLEVVQKSAELNTYCQRHTLNWQNEGELTRKIFNNIRHSPEYEVYMNLEACTFKEDKEFVIDIFKNQIANFELLESSFEERSIHWVDDLGIANAMVIKTLEQFEEADPISHRLMPLYKSEEEDIEFVTDLYRKTIINDKANEKYIADKTQNWEVERIALMDVLLMKMAITEILYFPTIPVKVSLNEYIEISKMFSTPKSKIFINGILDKLVVDFRESGEMKKMGRGLME